MPPLPSKVQNQIAKAELPTGGEVPFEPSLVKNRRGDDVIEKGVIQYGPRKNKVGYVDLLGRIWIKDRAHAEDPDHWDVQVDGGRDYFRVDLNGNRLP
jgi:hypothetical protein